MGYRNSRIIVFRRSGDDRVEVKEYLTAESDFMRAGQKSISRLEAISSDGGTLTARCGVLESGAYEYAIRRIRLSVPEFEEGKD